MGESLVSRLDVSLLIPVRLWKKREIEKEGPSKSAVSLEDVSRLFEGAAHQPLNKGATQRAPLWARKTDASFSRDAPSPARKAYQTQAYFHPFVRQFLTDEKRCRVFERKDIGFVNLNLHLWDKPAEKMCLRVLACEAWCFEASIAVLRLDLTIQAEPHLTLSQVQRTLDQIRRLYPPYFAEVPDRSANAKRADDGAPRTDTIVQGGHCPWSVELLDDQKKPIIDGLGSFNGDDKWINLARSFRQQSDDRAQSYPWAGHWKQLLKPLVTDAESGDPEDIFALQLGDDRAPILSKVGFKSCGALGAVDRGNWVRLCFADAPGSDPLPYAQQFLAKFEERHCYDRFWYVSGESGDAPSRIMNCGYAFTWAGCASDRFFKDDANGAAFTFQHLYVPMGIIAHFHRAALLAASAQLSAHERFRASTAPPTPEEREGTRNDLADLHLKFVTFAQKYWFDEISPQEQAIQLFGMWRSELRLQELYDELREELTDMIAIDSAAKQNEINEQATRLATRGIPIAATTLIVSFLALLAGIFGMNTLDATSIQAVFEAGIVTSIQALFEPGTVTIAHKSLIASLALALAVAMAAILFIKRAFDPATKATGRIKKPATAFDTATKATGRIVDRR